MSKKIFSIILVLALAVGILVTSLSRISGGVQTSFAAASLKFTVGPAPESTSSQKIEYSLPYPGILPDHPFYKLKMARDRIWLWLTTDPVKKTELLLLFADKRIGAGKALLEGNQISLGISTLIKGEKYFEQAAAEANKAKEKGKNIRKVAESLQKAALKYEEVLSDLRGRNISSEGKTALDDLLQKISNLKPQVEELLK